MPRSNTFHRYVVRIENSGGAGWQMRLPSYLQLADPDAPRSRYFADPRWGGREGALAAALAARNALIG